jgi:hypothetical protein
MQFVSCQLWLTTRDVGQVRCINVMGAKQIHCRFDKRSRTESVDVVHFYKVTHAGRYRRVSLFWHLNDLVLYTFRAGITVLNGKSGYQSR